MSTLQRAGNSRPQRERVRTGHVVRRRATIRRIDPWSILKLSLIFNFISLLIAMVAVYVFWSIIQNMGLIDTLTEFLDTLSFTLIIHTGNIGRALFLFGLLNVVLWTGVHVFLAFLYNLVADLLGGIRVELASEE